MVALYGAGLTFDSLIKRRTPKADQVVLSEAPATTILLCFSQKVLVGSNHRPKDTWCNTFPRPETYPVKHEPGSRLVGRESCYTRVFALA